ncbi:hypothetical protein RM543_17880 [Roseicyclus sp. F158]|uniref:AP2 domain-containing protein n=1 Tax=Tropicimonas omnivorans TaxID=3075590 RepID=A0ABU3DLE6_9RHOB|nr:hypothetical protein [Roseicyclus sp. F158]MDT0684545.1 hypothetical protein [Roseicyclus sp. F158]
MSRRPKYPPHPTPPDDPGRRFLDQSLRKLRGEGYRGAGARSPGRRPWNAVSEMERLEVRPEGDGWVAELGFKTRWGRAAVFLRVPARGCYPSRRQAEVEARNALRRLMRRVDGPGLTAPWR